MPGQRHVDDAPLVGVEGAHLARHAVARHLRGQGQRLVAAARVAVRSGSPRSPPPAAAARWPARYMRWSRCSRACQRRPPRPPAAGPALALAGGRPAPRRWSVTSAARSASAARARSRTSSRISAATAATPRVGGCARRAGAAGGRLRAPGRGPPAPGDALSSTAIRAGLGGQAAAATGARIQDHVAERCPRAWPSARAAAATASSTVAPVEDLVLHVRLVFAGAGRRSSWARSMLQGEPLLHDRAEVRGQPVEVEARRGPRRT